MLTNNGKTALIRYIGKYNSDLVTDLAIGAGAKSESASDSSLDLQFYSVPVETISVDQISKKIYYKSTLPIDLVGKIYEVGAFYKSGLSDNAQFSSVVFNFDQNYESWSTFASGSNSRTGNSMLLAAATSATTVTTLQNFLFNLSTIGYGSLIKMGIYSNANTQSVTLKLGTDSSNYYQKTFSTIVSGYQVLSDTFENFTKVGTPDIESIAYAQLTIVAKSSGSSSVEFDIIVIEDSASFSAGTVLVGRKLLTVPVDKLAGQELEIQYELDIT